MKTKMTVSEVRNVLEVAFNNAICDDDVQKAIETRGLKCPISISELQAHDPEEQVEYLCLWNNIG